jgi:protein NRD1
VDKRHAFIKMINRRDAQKARDGMEDYREGSTQLRVRSSICIDKVKPLTCI